MAALFTEAHTGVFRSVSRTSTTRPGSPPRRAAFGFGDEAVAAGWLHDTIDEDTWVTVGLLRATRFPETVITAGVSVSRVPGEPYFGLAARAAVDPIGRYVKLADTTRTAPMSRVPPLNTGAG